MYLFYISILAFCVWLRILNQVKEELDLEHVSFIGLFQERREAQTMQR